MNDIDYIKFASEDEFQAKTRDNSMTDKDLDIVRNIPEIKLDNKLYHNTGNLKFKDQQNFIQNNKVSYSNGAVYADFVIDI